MQDNCKDNGNTSRFDQILAALGADKNTLSAGTLNSVNPNFRNEAELTAFFDLAGVPAPQRAKFPDTPTVMVANTITVTPANPLVINPGSSTPVIFNVDTLIMETGGQIQCNTSVVLTIEEFIKQ